jgi:hypothetical protein
MATNKKKLFPEGVPKTTALGKEIQAALDAYDASVEAGANAMLYQPEVAESSSSTPSSPLRPDSNSFEALFGVEAKAPLGDQVSQAPMTIEEEKVRTQDIVSQLTTIKSAVGGDQNKFIQQATPLLENIKSEIAAKYQGKPELIRRYVEGVHEIFNKFAVT